MNTHHPPPPPPPVAARFAALLGFLRGEALGGMLLMAAAFAALVWANAGSGIGYAAFLHTHISVLIAGQGLDWDVHQWVNDGLMALFFLLVGLEIRRELTRGELAGWRRAAAPAIAAIGGMVAPALIYLGFTWHDPAAMRGWAVPVATDIAFSLAVLRLLGARVPMALVVFLTALAIMDDLGAIAVIALFYTDHLHLGALGAALALWLVLFALGRGGVRSLAPYMLGGVVLWLLVLRSGVHATLAGVALAFVVPMAPGRDARDCPAERLEAALHPWVSMLVVPLFGLTNAGLRLDTLEADAWRDPLVAGIALGLFAGKQLGVFGATFLARAVGLIRLPGRMTLLQLYGVSLLCGIGFTMSLFIGDLGFRGAGREEAVKFAVLAGSLTAALAGLGVLALATRRNAGAPAVEDPLG